MRSRIVRPSHGLPVTLSRAFAAGCTESEQPTVTAELDDLDQPLHHLDRRRAASAATGRGVDGEFTRMARQIPGFGGMYFDKSGKLTVYVKPPAAGAALRSTDVVSSLRAAGNAAVQQRLSKSATVVTKAAKYDLHRAAGLPQPAGQDLRRAWRRLYRHR